MSERWHFPHLRAVGSAPAAEQQPEPWGGITPPTRRGGSGRFVTDVLVQLGYTDQEAVERAMEEARSRGVQPEESPSVMGWITSISACSRWTWPRPTC